MMRQILQSKIVLLGLLLALAAPLGVNAQSGQFAPRVYVNNRAVSQYEVEQRMLFLKLLGGAKDPATAEQEALDALIEDRLRLIAAEQLGLKPDKKAVEAGMTEFASRANLTADQFIAALAQAGVEMQTFRDFVSAGFIWRELVRAKFGPLASVSEVEIDRAIAAISVNTAVEVRLSEIVLPAGDGQLPAALATARRLKARIVTDADFATTARSRSSAGSAGRGGSLGWTPVAQLPAAAVPVVMALQPGQVSAPVKLEGSVAIYMLHEMRTKDKPGAVAMSVDYAALMVPNDGAAAAELARIRAKVDVCNDLYGIARGLPADQLLRETRPVAQLPQDVAQELARLDPGESSTALVRGGARMFLMLCNRIPVLDVAPDRAKVRADLINQQLAAYADGYLADLRANAIIRTP